MNSTLLEIGRQKLEGQGIWAQLTQEPKFANDKKNWICPILFDCVNGEIKILAEKLERFVPEKTIIEFRYVSPSIWGPRGKKCALTVEVKNFTMLEETLFGKTDGDDGSMMESMVDFDEELKSTDLYQALELINENLNEQRTKLDLSSIKDQLTLPTNEDVVLFSAFIRSNAIHNGELVRLALLQGFDEFIIQKFATPTKSAAGVDYVTGELTDNAVEAVFFGRYNIHKIFQTTNSNYASSFSDFKKNFQSDPSTIAALDKASSYVLNKLQTRIAGISHIVTPDFRKKDLESFSLNETELFLKKSSELLFDYQTIAGFADRELPDIGLFWINYIGFESDGNSFKVISQIKDVNCFYLIRLLEVFGATGYEFSGYIGGKYSFNLRSVYDIVPVRDGNKSKVNQALALFKDILEQRKIDEDRLYKYFITLVLCHWYGRYKAYSNIRENNSFDFAVKDAVYRYSALFFALNKLNLIDMENTDKQAPLDSSDNSKEKDIQDFFNKMNYTVEQEAMFYLGRMLSQVAYAQYEKGHDTKPILNKINFNGMDAQAILRFSLSLAEKGRQYKIHRNTDWNLSRFNERFNENKWALSKEQAVFYLMAGYTFGMTKSINS